MWIAPGIIPNMKRELRKTYVSLNEKDFEWLVQKIALLIEHLAYRFDFKDAEPYWNQLFAKQSQDLRALANLLMPFLDDPTDEKKKRLTSFQEILGISKMRYDLYRLDKDQLHVLSQEDLEHNFQLLLQTLEAVSHKLYVNWFQTFPLRMDEIEDWEIYRNTLDKLPKAEIEYYDLEKLGNRSLSQSDLYQIVRSHLVEEMLPIKWLIFEIKYEGKIVSYYHLLKQYKLWPDKPWILLTKDIQDSYSASWLKFLNVAHFQPIQIALTFNILTHFRHKNKLDAGDILYLFVDQDEELDDDDEINFSRDREKSLSIVLGFLDRVNPGYIYEYLLQLKEEFEPTWYYWSLNQVDYFTQEKGIFLTHKNIFNVCKSLVSTDKYEKWTQLPMHWRSCTDEMKSLFLRRLGGIDMKWFSVTKNILKVYGTGINKFEVNQWILDEALKRIPLIIFQSGVKHGLFSIYKPGKRFPYIDKPDLTPFSKNCYYFPNGKEYPLKWLEKDLISGFLKWPDNYAVDWISQIHLYHRFMHKSVILVTGATGVGKSTQTPKLLLYSYKMINYAAYSRIICTVPRIAPATGNATWIATEMGLPISEGNFVMQYKHSEGSKTLDSANYVRISTDGSVVEAMYRSTYLVKGVTNIYDMVIVDEAHEHNSNMDIILSLAKISLLCNNSLKLVIISATIDDDEAIYRRFYRHINDNMAYPLNLLLEKYKLDRRFVDRRIHISAPGQTTKYEVRSHYLDKKEAMMAREDRVEYSVNKILSLAGQLKGISLLFLTGEGEIKKACIELNQRAPPDMIAMGFYGAMRSEDKQYVEHIAKNLPSHTKHRGTYYTDKQISDVPKGTYRRAIVVSTNIAEASVTIDGLSTVFDTGVAFGGSYDPAKDKVNMKIYAISNSSATQRRGRVGRVSDGDVYHLYEQDYLVKNKTKYDITQKDMKDTMYQLCRRYVKSVPITEKDSYCHPNFTGTNSELKKLYRIRLNTIPKIDRTRFRYLGNDPSISYLWKDYKLELYNDGYSSDIITDNKGTFYVIHPDELNIERNEMTGAIEKLIATDNEKYDTVLFRDNGRSRTGSIEIDKFISTRMVKFWERLLPSKMIIRRDYLYYKSELGEKLKDMSRKWTDMTKDWNYFLWYLNSSDDVKDFILFLISFITWGAEITKWSTYISTGIKDFSGRKSQTLGPLWYLYLLYCRFKIDFPNLSGGYKFTPELTIDKEKNIQEIRNIDPILSDPISTMHKLDNSSLDSEMNSLSRRSEELKLWAANQSFPYETLIQVIRSYIRMRYKVEVANQDLQKEKKEVKIRVNSLTFESSFWGKIEASISRIFWKYLAKKEGDKYLDLNGDLIDVELVLFTVPHQYIIYFPMEKSDKIEWCFPVDLSHVAESAAIDLYLYSDNSAAERDVYKYIPQRYLEIGEEDLIKLIHEKK